MARLNAQQAASFPQSSGRSNFLSLQNDGDTAIVRFAYNSTEELRGCDSVHMVKNNQTGKYVTIDCLKTDYSNPDSVCPLCAAGIRMQKVFYLQVRNEETGEMQLWQRSESFVNDTLIPQLKIYEDDGTPITGVPIKIVRKGARGDMNTKYTLAVRPVDGMLLDEFPDDIDVRKEGIVKEYDYNTLQNYVSTGMLPDNNNNQEITPRGNNTYANAGDNMLPRNMNQGPVQAPATRNRRTINNQGGY